MIEVVIRKVQAFVSLTCHSFGADKLLAGNKRVITLSYEKDMQQKYTKSFAPTVPVLNNERYVISCSSMQVDSLTNWYGHFVIWAVRQYDSSETNSSLFCSLSLSRHLSPASPTS